MGFLISTARRSKAHGEYKRLKAFCPIAVERLLLNSETIIRKTAQLATLRLAQSGEK